MYPEPQSIMLFGNRVFADVISKGFRNEIILALEEALNPGTGVFISGRKGGVAPSALGMEGGVAPVSRGYGPAGGMFLHCN